MRGARIQLAIGALGLALLAAGCATSSPPPVNTGEKRAKLFRTQVGDQVTLQWDSRPGIVYGVVYSTNIKDNRSWRLLPGYDQIMGNGGRQQITFTAPVPGKAYYRLRESRNR